MASIDDYRCHAKHQSQHREKRSQLVQHETLYSRLHQRKEVSQQSHESQMFLSDKHMSSASLLRRSAQGVTRRIGRLRRGFQSILLPW